MFITKICNFAQVIVQHMAQQYFTTNLSIVVSVMLYHEIHPHAIIVSMYSTNQNL